MKALSMTSAYAGLFFIFILKGLIPLKFNNFQ